MMVNFFPFPLSLFWRLHWTWVSLPYQCPFNWYSVVHNGETHTRRGVAGKFPWDWVGPIEHSIATCLVRDIYASLLQCVYISSVYQLNWSTERDACNWCVASTLSHRLNLRETRFLPFLSLSVSVKLLGPSLAVSMLFTFQWTPCPLFMNSN